MAREGLLISALPEVQRKAWLEINASKAYASSALELRRAYQCLSVLDRADLKDIAPDLVAHQQLNAVYADPGTDSGTGVIDLTVPAMPRHLRRRRK